MYLIYTKFMSNIKDYEYNFGNIPVGGKELIN